MVNGFAGLDLRDGLEGFARAPFPLAADISLDGVRLSQAVDRVRFVEQGYDFQRAELTTLLDFRIADATARIEVLRSCRRSESRSIDLRTSRSPSGSTPPVSTAPVSTWSVRAARRPRTSRTACSPGGATET
jgi:hypothetical protein